MNQAIRVLLYDSNLASPTLLEDLTDRVTGLMISTVLHGGFKTCSFKLAASVPDAWPWLHDHRESGAFGQLGRHFNRVVVQERAQVGRGSRVVWEGRVIGVELHVTRRFVGLMVQALGYWSACRDQTYSASDHTDWTSGGPHTADEIVKELLTEECPDINSDQSNIDANDRDVVGVDLGKRRYPQDIIVDDLASMSDSDNSVWHFAIWDDRKPHWKKRTVTTPNYRVWLGGERSGVKSLRLKQDATHLRNAITPIVSGTEGAEKTDDDSLGAYPRRELLLTLPTGANSDVRADAARTAAADRATPKQTQSFTIDGHIFASGVNKELFDVPKWRVRAGESLHIQDLIPAPFSSGLLDSLRTFFIIETSYDFDSDVLKIQPDSHSRSLASLLPRFGSVERNR